MKYINVLALFILLFAVTSCGNSEIKTVHGKWKGQFLKVDVIHVIDTKNKTIQTSIGSSEFALDTPAVEIFNLRTDSGRVIFDTAGGTRVIRIIDKNNIQLDGADLQRITE